MTAEHIPIGLLFDVLRECSTLNAEAQAHLETCRDCQRKVSWMRTMREMGRDEFECEPPPELLSNAIAVGYGSSIAPRAVILIYDSFAELMPVGVRREDLLCRELIYEFGDLRLRLQIHPANDTKLTIVGQVTSTAGSVPSLEELEVTLVSKRKHMTTRTNELGEFVFESVDRIRYGLKVAVSGRLLALEDLPILDSYEE